MGYTVAAPTQQPAPPMCGHSLHYKNDQRSAGIEQCNEWLRSDPVQQPLRIITSHKKTDGASRPACSRVSRVYPVFNKSGAYGRAGTKTRAYTQHIQQRAEAVSRLLPPSKPNQREQAGGERGAGYAPLPYLDRSRIEYSSGAACHDIIVTVIIDPRSNDEAAKKEGIPCRQFQQEPVIGSSNHQAAGV